MTSLTKNPPAPPPLSSSTNDERLSLTFPYRLTTALGVSSLAGFALGVSHGSRTTSLRFRAENAHRLPTSSTGWYLYHKSKNYHVMYGSLGEGLKMGFKMGLWVGMFFTVEEAIDRLRGRKDVASTVVGGLGVAGAWSLWNQFPMVTAARTAKSGLLFGLAYGFAQDILSLAKGHKLRYVDFILGTNRRERREAKLREAKFKEKIAQRSTP